MLALECVGDSYARPTMKQVVKRLLNLCAVRKHADELGIKQMLRDSDSKKAALYKYMGYLIRGSH